MRAEALRNGDVARQRPPPERTGGSPVPPRRAALPHGGARGGSLRPFSPPAFLDPGSRQEPMSAHICLSACAGLPAPWLLSKTPKGGFRTRGLARELLSIQAAGRRLPPSCASRSRGIRAFPQGSPRILYQYQLIYYFRYCRIFDTAFRYF